MTWLDDATPGHPLGPGMPGGSTLREDGDSHRDAWARVLRGDACSYCAAPGAGGTVDHVDPTSRGGSYRVGNLTGACASCNESKGARTDLLLWMRARSRQRVARERVAA